MGPPVHQQLRGRLPDGPQLVPLRPSQQQQRQPQQPKQPQQQQSAPPEGHHPGSAAEAPPLQPPGGIAPPGVAQAQLQRALQDMMGAGLHHQVGGAKPTHCFAPPMATPPNFLAPPMRPPPFPGANGQAPPHPDVQNLLFRIQQQQQQQHMQAQPQDLSKHYGQWPMNMPPPRHPMPWPPNLPPHGQQEQQQHVGGFLGQRPPPPHGIPHPSSLLLPPPHQQAFLCGPPSKPAFSTTPSTSQPVFAGAMPCVGGEQQQQWDSPSVPHPAQEAKSVPSQE